MSRQGSPETPDPSPTQLARIDEACDRFEAEWKVGRHPRIEDFLAPARGSDREFLLVELLALEIELRRKGGDQPTPQEYRPRFPDEAAQVEAAFRDLPAMPKERPEARPPSGDDLDAALHFGLLARQNEVVSTEELRAALAHWAEHGARPLGRILVDRGVLDEERAAILEALARQPLRQGVATPSPRPIGDETVGPDDGRPEDVDDAAYWETRPHAPGASSGGAGVPAPSVGAPRYRVVRHHARGGLGEVYVAEDTELRREVALKEIQSRHAHDLASRSRFVLEAEVTGALEHPGIVPVYGLGYYPDGRPYYAMRFIRGESLREAIDRYHARRPERDEDARALEFRGLLRRFLDVCNAVAFAHSRGVLHRDVKPNNVMLGPYGETLVVDWGLAKPLGRPGPRDKEMGDALRPASSSGSAPTVAGSALGTPSYMSPEQAAGDLGRVGPASDVYSLGATLYCLLTGCAPIEDSDVDWVLVRAQRGDFRPPRLLNRSVPPALEAVCLKAMALRPEDRYATPRDLADDIERWMADDPVTAYDEPVAQRLGRWARRHKPWVAGAAAVLIVAVATLGVAAVLIEGARRSERTQRHVAEIARGEAAERAASEADARRREEAEHTLAEAARLRAETARREETRARRQAEVQSYLSGVALAGREWQSGNAARVEELLNEAPFALRDWEWHYLKRQTSTGHTTIIGGYPGAFSGVAYSPDGTRLASCGWHGDLKVWDAVTGRLLLDLNGLFGHRGHILGVAYCPDGTRIASAGQDGTVRLWDAGSGKAIRTIRAHEGGAFCVAFHPGGKLLASGGGDRTARVWDVETGKERHALKGHSGGVAALAYSADGTRMATAGAMPDPSLRVWDADGREVRVLNGAPSGTRAVAFHPDGRTIASAGEDGGVRLWDIGKGGVRAALLQGGRPVTALAFRPDGAVLASAGLDRVVRLWDVEAAEPRSLFRGHAAGLTCLAFAPDGRHLVAGDDDGLATVWDATREQEAIRPDGGRVPTASLAFSPDGARVAAAVAAEVRLWDARDGTPGPIFKGHEQDVLDVVFDPGGTRVASVDTGGTVKVWDLTAAREPLSLRLTFPPSDRDGPFAEVRLAFSSDGRRLMCAGTGGEVRAWSLPDGAEARPFRIRRPAAAFGVLGSDALTAVAFRDDGERLAAAGLDGTVRVYDTARGEEVAVVRGDMAVTTGLAFSADGRYLAIASAREQSGSGEIRLCDLHSGRTTLSFAGPAGLKVPLVFGRDAGRLAVGDSARGVVLYDAQTGWELLATEAGGAHRRDLFTRVAFSPNGDRLALASLRGVQIWDATPGRQVLALKHPGIVSTLAYSPDGRRLASSSGRTIHIEDAATGRVTTTLSGRSESAATIWTGLAWSRDGRRIAAGELNGTVVVWDVATGQVLAELRGHSQPVLGIAFSPDGRRLATGSHDKTAKLWDLSTFQEIGTMRSHTDRVNGVAFIDGDRFVTASRDKTLKVWDARTGRELRTLVGHKGSIGGVAMSPDGRRLASWGGRRGGPPPEGPPSGEVRFWDVVTWDAKAPIPDSDQFLYAGAFSPDGRTFATAGDDPTVRLWDTESGRERLALPGHQAAVTRLSFDAGGRFLASAGNDRRVYVWDVAPAEARSGSRRDD